ncbi:hypothetical protein [Leucobacter sp. G161]|uniref:hypothetical protein n=1 Tax=Leucobacter sp. G161 TaxID=663704 RepID=UPI00073BC124|nr:hypothetical protein [Leucobacter sp. G161]KUF07077.1 hypothetical protein AUL38_01885 [Leucobacter sp. G161]
MAVPQFLRRFITPGRPERAALYTVALGAAALIDPAKLTPGGRAAYRLALAGITAAVVAGDTPRELGPQGRAAAATVAGGAVLGLAEAGEALDGTLQRSLARRGVRRPRLVFAAVTAGLAFATELPALLANRRGVSYRSGNSQHMAVVDHVPFGEVPEGARTLITGMLDFSADPGSEALRAQLASARERLGDGGSGSFDTIDIVVLDAEALPRAVPHRQQFPVVAEFADPNTGSPRVVRLGIDGGSLAQLTIEADDRAADSPWLWPERWPALAEVTFSVEGSEPVNSRAAKLARAAGRD